MIEGKQVRTVMKEHVAVFCSSEKLRGEYNFVLLTRLTQVEHVKREKEIMQFATDHPNLIALAGSMQDTRNLYLVLELAHGVHY